VNHIISITPKKLVDEHKKDKMNLLLKQLTVSMKEICYAGPLEDVRFNISKNQRRIEGNVEAKTYVERNLI
jgi:hypothetical protein